MGIVTAFIRDGDVGRARIILFHGVMLLVFLRGSGNILLSDLSFGPAEREYHILSFLREWRVD